MVGDVVHQVEVQVLILLLVASLVGMLARRSRVPYTLALVVAGLGISFVHLPALSDVALTPELLLLLFLPPLLFEAAYHLPFDDLRKNRVHIFYLAIIGVLVATTFTAVLAYAGIHGSGLLSTLGWTEALLFAAVISATDPISVLALFKEMGAPKRLYQVVEGESLINDGMAVVVFVILGAVLGVTSVHGQAPVLEDAHDIAVFAVISFTRISLGGLGVGAAIGALASVLTRQVDDHLIEITLTTLVAWGSFLLAEQLHVSGVLSTVAAGIMMGSFGKYFGMSPSTRMAVQDFWEYMGFLSNSFIFLLIGIELEPSALLRHAPVIAVGFLAVVVARAIVIYGGLPIADRLAAVALPRSWRHILVWGGLRGSLSMVLVLGLPADFPGRSLLIDLVFGVVAVSLFLQGLTMAPLMKKLGLRHTSGLATSRDYERARGRDLAFRQVLNEADRMLEQGLLDELTHGWLRGWYQQAGDRSRREARKLAGTSAEPERLLEGARTLATIEKEAIERAVRSGVISEGSGTELMTELDRRLDGLDRAAGEGEPELLAAMAQLYPVRKPPPASEEARPPDSCPPESGVADSDVTARAAREASPPPSQPD